MTNRWGLLKNLCQPWSCLAWCLSLRWVNQHWIGKYPLLQALYTLTHFFFNQHWQISKGPLTPKTLSALRTSTGFQGNTLSRVRMSASKPNFEVGSSSQLKLSFGKKTLKPGMWSSPSFCYYFQLFLLLLAFTNVFLFLLQKTNQLLTPMLKRRGPCQPMTWMMMMWCVFGCICV